MSEPRWLGPGSEEARVASAESVAAPGFYESFRASLPVSEAADGRRAEVQALAAV